MITRLNFQSARSLQVAQFSVGVNTDIFGKKVTALFVAAIALSARTEFTTKRGSAFIPSTNAALSISDLRPLPIGANT
ncbi:MAG: hypothetical protein WBR17_38085, partial [Paraburkholderia sp.]|uniref:hypothetical protein n=1 Tax=Paraburkholderia sp. TaxID=1926495 RepID=UPI003C490394